MRDHISVCICTYKRPELLSRLLRELQNQKTEESFLYSIVVVDNDCTQSAKSTVESFMETSRIDIEYYCEPEQNISLARNKAVQKARGNFLAFLDDDEIPINDWLLTLYKAQDEYKADGVLGPVKSHFEIKPPKWVIRGKLFERESFKTGSVVRNVRHMRTGNVLLSRKTFNDEESFFDPRFGRTGGEDADFFKRMISRGRIFIWCNESCVYETVPPERLRRTYLLKRALLRGVSEARLRRLSIYGFSKSIVAFALYTSALPILFIMGHHWFMRYLIKDCDHIGKLLAACGLEPVKERTF